jgi:phospho-N-acetylmuramoyl-pentapeptide-transferase
MLYHLFDFLERSYSLPGAGVFKYLSFRSATAIILALLIGVLFGRMIINLLTRKQIGETVRNLGLEGQMAKRGTPTMGGLIILASIVAPTLLLADLTNIYVILLLASTVWLGAIGFLDDYIKVFRKNKEGLKGRFKIVGQVGLGLIVGSTMWASDGIVVREKMDRRARGVDSTVIVDQAGGRTVYLSPPQKTTKTTIPFVKNNEFDYGSLLPGEGRTHNALTWLLYIAIAILIITFVSNCANLTDGLDGLTTGVSAPVVVILGVLAYLSGNVIYSDYLNIMYLPHSGEMVVFASAFVGALVGFLWYNGYPAQVFMGDTGSLSIGGVIAVFALLIRKELLLPILCGVFFVEGLSVMLQVGYFKYTKRRYGEGRRALLMAPLHHHYQKRGFPESKIVLRFWIVQILLAAVAIITLKVR